jgi:hypothetical protein
MVSEHCSGGIEAKCSFRRPTRESVHVGLSEEAAHVEAR